MLVNSYIVGLVTVFVGTIGISLQDETKWRMPSSAMRRGFRSFRPLTRFPMKSQIKNINDKLMLVKKTDPLTGVWVQSVMSNRNPTAAFQHMAKKLKNVVAAKRKYKLLPRLQGFRMSDKEKLDDFGDDYSERKMQLKLTMRNRNKLLTRSYNGPRHHKRNFRNNRLRLSRLGHYGKNMKSPKFSLNSARRYSNALLMQKKYKKYDRKRQNIGLQSAMGLGRMMTKPNSRLGRQMNLKRPSFSDDRFSFDSMFDETNFNNNFGDVQTRFPGIRYGFSDRFFGGFDDSDDDDRKVILNTNTQNAHRLAMDDMLLDGFQGRANSQKGGFIQNRNLGPVAVNQKPDFRMQSQINKGVDQTWNSKEISWMERSPISSVGVEIPGSFEGQAKGNDWKSNSGMINDWKSNSPISSIDNQNIAPADNALKKPIYDKKTLHKSVTTELSSTADSTSMTQAHDKTIPEAGIDTNVNLLKMTKKSSKSGPVSNDWNKLHITNQHTDMNTQLPVGPIQALPINPFSSEEPLDITEFDSSIDDMRDVDQATFALLGIGPNTVSFPENTNIGDANFAPEHPPPIHVPDHTSPMRFPADQNVWRGENMFPGTLGINQNNALPSTLQGSDGGFRGHMSDLPFTRSELIRNTIKDDFDRLSDLDFGMDGIMPNFDNFGNS